MDVFAFFCGALTSLVAEYLTLLIIEKIKQKKEDKKC